MPEHRFLDSDFPGRPETPQFRALGSPGSGTYVGLETFDNPGCSIVTYRSDEVMSKCPITGQPDFYEIVIQLTGCDKCIESKSLKLWFQNIITLSFTTEFGIFCEALAVHVRDTIAEAIGEDDSKITVQLSQKSRGGITIVAVA